MELQEKVLDILAEICEDDCVRQDLSLPLFENDLLDSLAVVELLVELESAFGIVLSPSEVTREDIGTPQKRKHSP